VARISVDRFRAFYFVALNAPVLPGRSDAVAVTVTPGFADASTVVVYFHDPLAAHL
jgi:hypothetical protein